MLLVVESEARTGEASLFVAKAELLVAAVRRAVEGGVAGDTLAATVGCVEAV